MIEKQKFLLTDMNVDSIQYNPPFVPLMATFPFIVFALAVLALSCCPRSFNHIARNKSCDYCKAIHDVIASLAAQWHHPQNHVGRQSQSDLTAKRANQAEDGEGKRGENWCQGTAAPREQRGC